MQVVIPMTGYGSRFKAAGYEDLKPFIKVGGKPMIEWVLSMYPADSSFYLIMRDSEVNKYAIELSKFLTRYPTIRVLTVNDESWKKKGPVYDALSAIEAWPENFSGNDSLVINYCDFFCLWNAKDFDENAKKGNFDGAIPCYTGFHPHLIPNKNVYASCKVKGGLLQEIREKFSFEEDKTKAHHSPGIYWFKDIRTFKKYARKQIFWKAKLNGEYYASLTYNFLVKDRKSVWVSDCVPYFCQWGTPEDLKEFELWMSELGGNK